jgi:hypothetical protein
MVECDCSFFLYMQLEGWSVVPCDLFEERLCTDFRDNV